jgi:NADH:ubiquinone oxidoreductase subunit F (NADH-binding)
MAIRHLQQALKQARELGLLGENILGTGLSFDIEIVKGAGAFVCGEETALLESIEDRIGEPRPKPPFPVIRGLWDWPTVLNNVKTWASCRYILENGPEVFAKVGTEGSKGTMVFALVGKVRNSGLIEVPMGVTLRDIVEKIGSGVPEGGKPKAVQTGGPSGGCLPASKFDMPVDYASLTEAGTIMGSGGMIVMDEHTCMVDTARYFLNFAVNESCGKCTPCREGVRHMHDILVDITAGRGRPEHLDMLDQIGRMIIKLSFCGLGKTAPNPVISTLRYFREEYEAHLAGKCPAKVCTALIKYTILDTCVGCGACLKKCPVGAISGSKREIHRIDPQTCTKCGICRKTCKFAAIEVD